MGIPTRSRPLSSIEVGDLIYFHAFEGSNKDIHFLCKGFIHRLPTRDSPVYKVTVLSICPTTLTHGTRQDLASLLLNKHLPCPIDQISKICTDWMKKVYPSEETWLSLSRTQIVTIKNKIRNQRELQNGSSQKR